jgi:hypothetical protein
MAHNDAQLSHGDEYIVFYTGGPYDGRSDRRISTDGSWDIELTVLVALDGKETMVVYNNPVAHTVGEQVQVTYSWDAADGEPLEALDERRD